MIQIHLLSGTAVLSIIESTPESLPRPGDQRLSIDVKMEGLTFKKHSFWVSADEWRSFLREALQLLKTLKGTAAFRSMSPGSMQFILEPSRSSRRLKVTINTNSLGLGSSSFPKLALYLEDEIDSEWLTDLEGALKIASNLLPKG